MTLTYHVLLDALENHHLDRLMTHLAIVRPHYINLTAAARYDQAPDVIRRICATVPGIRVIWRGWKSDDWKDEGLWTRETPQQWYDYRVAPHRDFLKQYRVILCGDNESGTENAKGYAQWHADCMALLAKDGLQMAALRTSTGTPAEDKYADMEVAYRAMAKYGGILSPNEYASNVPGESSGNLERYKRHWEQFKRLGLPTPVTVIGEFAILKTIANAYDGYPTFNADGREYAGRSIALIEAWYKPFGVWACLYSFGKWGNGLGVQDDEGFLSEVEAYYKANPNPPIGQPPPVVVQPPAVPLPTQLGLPNKVTITTAGYRVRDEAKTGGMKVGTLQAGEQVVIYGSPVENADGYMWHVVERLDTVPAGESKRGWTAYPLPAAPPVTEPPIPPIEEYPNNPPTAPGLELVFPFPPGTTAEIANAIAGMFAHAYVREVKKAA